MKPVSGWVLAAGLFLTATASGADSSFVEGLERRLRGATANETAGVAVLVARDGKIVYQGGFGLADLTQKTPITPETKFRIGSITKQFTAAAVLKLAEQGKLSLADPLTRFFPDFPNGAAVTVRHLLTHTSGLQSYTDKSDFRDRVTTPIEPAALIASFQNDPPNFAPGAGFRYNNSGYFLLGEIVAQVSGKPFSEFLRTTFFVPLGMNDTGIYANASPPPGMALGYSFRGGKHLPAHDWDMSWAGGAGALYSTVEDLFRWNEAFFGGRVLSAASVQAAVTPVKLPPGVDGMRYGYGFVMAELKRLPVIGHGGGLDGWSSDLMRLPEQRCTIIVLTNALPPAPGFAPAQISRSIVEQFLADEIQALPPLAEDSSVDPKIFAQYVGRYDYRDAIMTVTTQSDGLFAQLTGQPKFQIFPRAPNEFFWKVTDAHVTFVRNDRGEVFAAQHTQGGNTFRARKLGDEPASFTAEQLERFVARYRYGQDSVMTVTRDGTQLFAQLTAQPRFPIYPKSEFVFEWRVVPAHVQFVLADDGTVSKGIHTQNGQTIEALVVRDP